MDFKGTFAVIPAYNVADRLNGVLSQIRRFIPPDRVVVVDDGSSDGTGKRTAGFGAQLIRHPGNLGKGEALKTGLRFCVSAGADRVFTLDGDGQHDPDSMPFFIQALERTESDLVAGVRDFKPAAMPLDRILSNRLSSMVVSLAGGGRVLDSQCGFRLYKRKVIEALRPRTHRYETETEMLLLALAKGFKIGWCPVETRYSGQESHIRRLPDTIRFLKVIGRFV
jgi:glycosyltransferase involved in cell wall biosynthesis